jgi:hypothetical protein
VKVFGTAVDRASVLWFVLGGHTTDEVARR